MAEVEDDSLFEHWLSRCHQAVVESDGSSAVASLPFDLDESTVERLGDATALLDQLEAYRRACAGGSQPSAALSVPLADELGQLEALGRYRIERELGRGGQAIVFLAFDPVLGRPLALKVLRPELLLSASMRKRFLREAQVTARLSHPHLLSIFEAGEVGPLCYIASSYCSGPTLHAWMAAQQAPVPQQLAARIVLALAEAADYAHQRGVVHRDIKPGNVFLEVSEAGLVPLASDDAEGTAPLSAVPKLGDFGMARDAEVGATLAPTRQGALVGTPAYMAPEQALGQQDRVGPATDVHALGLLLYELLTGRSPFQGRSDADSLRRVVGEEPQRPSRACRDISPDLEAICLRSLEKEPTKRYPSARALAADLERFLQGEPTHARPLNSLQRLAKWARRRPAEAMLGAALAVALLTLLVGLLVYSSRLSHALSETVEAKFVAEREVEVSRRLLYNAKVRVAYDSWKGGNPARARELLAETEPGPGQEDLREFAWHALNRQVDQAQLVLSGHEGEVYCVAWSPDGQTLASCGPDRTIRLWEASSGRQVRVLYGHDDEVNTVVWGPQGRWLASASDDRTVRMWDTATGRQTALLEGHEDWVYALALSPDATLLASGGMDGRVLLWNPRAAGEAPELLGQCPDGVQSLTFSPDGQTLAVCLDSTDPGLIHWWDVPSRRLVSEGQFPKGTATNASFAHDRPLCAGSAELALCVFRQEQAEWNVKHQRDIRDKASALSFSPLDGTLALGADKFVELWRLDWKDIPWRRRTFIGHTEGLRCIAWSPDGRCLASASRDGTIRLWDPFATDSGAEILWWAGERFNTVTLSPDGSQLAIGCDGGTVRLWDLHQEDAVGAFRVHDRAILAAAVSGDGKQIIAQTRGHLVLAADRRSGRIDKLAPAMDGTLLPPTMAVGFRTQRLVVGGDEFRCIDLRNRKLLFESGEAYGVCLSPSERWLATFTNNEVCVHDFDSGQQLHQFPQIRGNFRCIAFSPRDDLLAAGNEAGEVRLWEMDHGKLVAVLPGHPGSVYRLAFSPDGHTLAAGSDGDSLTRLWDVRAREQLGDLTAGDISVRSHCFDASGKRLLFVGNSGGVGVLGAWSIDHSLPTDRRSHDGACQDVLPLAEFVAPVADHFVILHPPSQGSPPLKSGYLRIDWLLPEQVAGATGSDGRMARGLGSAIDRAFDVASEFETWQWPLPSGYEPRCYTAGDIDGDGRTDLVLGIRQPGLTPVIVWLRNLGERNFEEPRPLEENAEHLHQVELIDFDGDGDLDVLYSGGPTANEVFLLRNEGFGAFASAERLFATPQVCHLLRCVDIDGDGDDDIVIGDEGVDDVFLAENLGEGAFAPVRALLPENRRATQYIDFADIDGDGDLDGVTISYAEGEVAWYENLGGLNFAAPRLISLSAKNGIAVASADLDGDGLPEVVYTAGSDFFWQQNLGEGKFGPAAALARARHRPAFLLIADLDGDGDRDVIATAYREYQALWIQNAGNGAFLSPQALQPTVLENKGLVADLDGDGRPEVITVADSIHFSQYRGYRFDFGVEPPRNFVSAPPLRRELPVPRPAMQVGATALQMQFYDSDGRLLANDVVRRSVESVELWCDADANGLWDAQHDQFLVRMESLDASDGTITIPLPGDLDNDRKEALAATVATRLQEVDAWARQRGYAGGYATFWPSSPGSVHAVLFQTTVARRVRIPSRAVDDLSYRPRRDYLNYPDLVAHAYRSAYHWACEQQGFSGGVPTLAYFPSSHPGDFDWEVLLLNIPGCEEKTMHREDLGWPTTLEATFSAIHGCATSEGALAAFPIDLMHSEDVRMLLLPSNAPGVELVEIPDEELK